MITGEISNKIAVHNIAGGITGPDARVKSIAAQIMERRPTTLFMPEAYDLDKPGAQTRVENFAGEMSNIYFVGYKEYDGKSGGYMALVRKDRAVQPEQQLEFGKEQLVNGNSYYFKMLSFAGRGAVEMSFHDPKSGRLVTEVGLHANTLEQERGLEVTEFLAQYQGTIERGLPLVLAGRWEKKILKHGHTAYWGAPPK
ncbi:MAG TPA: hypothetical protein VFT53_00530 [Candidatus Saccharimonadales bacterium]|nr:hypothetical protein [Candidatus Saccharimonadales bacterium]